VLEPVGRVVFGIVVFVVDPVEVVKFGVEPVLVYCDEVDPVGRVVFGTVVFVVESVDVEKLGVEPVLVYCVEVEPVGIVGVVVEDVIDGFNVVVIVVVCCGEVIGVEEAVVDVASKSGLSQQVYLTSIRFLIKF